MRTFRTSAGLPAMPPRKPEAEDMPTREMKLGVEVGVVKFSFSCS